MSGTVQVTPLDEFERKLAMGRRLIVKLGADPTAPDLHLGHVVVLSKLAQFQDAGHQVIFLIGDFTAQIGDPTDKSGMRPPLSPEKIAYNMQTYFEQVGKILDMNKVIVRKNSEWLSLINLGQMISLCSKVTLARLIQRDDFAKRMADHQPIAFHELLYPLLQGYDSIALNADVEIGGTDQTFNLLMGRFLQEQYGQDPQLIMTMPLLEGTDGVHKMSKSLGNAIALTDSADQAFGKLMSIPDAIVLRYYALLLHYDNEQCAQLQRSVADGSLHPMILKKQMAHAVVAKFWSSSKADEAQKNFETIFQKKDYTYATEYRLPVDFPNPAWIVDLLKVIGAVQSSSDARRLIEAKAVTIDELIITDFKATISWKSGMVIKAGKLHISKIF